MTTAAQHPFPWMHSAVRDSLFYSFGWLLVLVPLLVYQDSLYLAIRYSTSLDRLQAHPALVVPALTVLVVLLVNYVHRHLTFLLVYGEKEEFLSHPVRYTALPAAFAVITAGFICFESFAVLAMVSVLWTMYHSVAQKYGITRIYARKAGYGDARVDRGIVWSWFVYLVMAMPGRERSTLELFSAGRRIVELVGDHPGLLETLSSVTLLAALVLTGIYIIQEFRNRARISLPKNLYVISVLVLYAVILNDLLVGYIAFAFSHGLEYIAFVNMYVKRKYQKRPEAVSLLARASRRLWLYSGMFSITVVAFSLLGMYFGYSAFAVYIVATSFLHFLYDSWIWKIRRPDVGQPLDIHYAAGSRS